MKRLTFCGVFLGLVVGVLHGCKNDAGPTVGSESHFLRACTGDCGTDCECICNVCSRVCTNDTDCHALSPNAQCVNVAARPTASSCPGESTTAFCDIPCYTRADCTALGSEYTCEHGFCREDPMTRMIADRKIDTDELCTFYVNDVCDAKIQCYGWTYPSKEACLAAQECDGWADFQSLLSSEHITFDPVAAFDCHQKLVTDPCSLGIFLGIPSLVGTLRACGASVGLVTEGQPCTGSDCSEGTACYLADSCPGYCKQEKNLAEGEPCTITICLDEPDCGPCAAGLTCHESVCRPDWKLGDPCVGISDCGPELWCNTALGQCAALATLGTTCSDSERDAPRCTSNAWCDGAGFATGICQPLSDTGGPCQTEADCREGLTCLPSTTGTTFGICSNPQANGAACNSQSDCQSDLCGSENTCIAQPTGGQACLSTCAAGSRCEDSLCLVERNAGETCDTTTYCLYSRCIDAVCTVRNHLGQSCTVNDDCLSSFCSNGICSDPVGCQ